MRAAVVSSEGRYEVTDVPDPSPGPGELLLRVTACGLCGSDSKARAAMPPGTIMGHELGGEVVAVGSEVDGWAAGDQAAVLPVLPCGKCERCLAGQVAHCATGRYVGLGGAPGGLAEQIVVTPLAAFAFPADLDPLHAALVEPFAVGLHVLHAARMQPGDDVVVIGSGTVGLTVMAWARAEGAGRVTAVDPMAARREVALGFGADDAVASLDDVAADAYDVVVECVGKPDLIAASTGVARTGGRIVVAGTCMEPAPINALAALMKELTIGFAVYYTPDEFRTVIDAFTTGRIDPAALVARTVDLARVDEAFDDLTTAAAAGKILVTP